MAPAKSVTWLNFMGDLEAALGSLARKLKNAIIPAVANIERPIGANYAYRMTGRIQARKGRRVDRKDASRPFMATSRAMEGKLSLARKAYSGAIWASPH